MKKLSFYFILLLILSSACHSLNVQKLTRVNFELSKPNSDETEIWMVIEKESLEELERAFKELKWESDREIQMSKKEDVHVTLFWEDDREMPEHLADYKIWFNDDDQTAIITSEREDEKYGELDEEKTELVKREFLNTSNKIPAP